MLYLLQYIWKLTRSEILAQLTTLTSTFLFVLYAFILLFMMQAKLALKFMFEQKLILNVNSTQTFKMPRRLRPLSLHSSKSKTMSILRILPRRSGLKNSLNTFYWSWKILNTSMPVCQLNYLAYILYISTMAQNSKSQFHFRYLCQLEFFQYLRLRNMLQMSNI